MTRLVLVVVATLAVLAGGSIPVVAAGDLGSLLADAPGIDWREASSDNPDVIEGPFTATSYADFIAKSSGSSGSTASALMDYGFNGGYGKEWQQFGSGDLLVERVFQFDSATGATSWWNDIKSGTESDTSYQGAIQGASAIPDSFGAVLKNPKFPTQWRLDFHKDNRVFVVHTDSDHHDLSSLAVSQAQKEYNGSAAGASQQTQAMLKPVMYGIATALFIILIGVVAVVVLATRRRTPAVVGAGQGAPFQLSPDGAFWWDGVRWHDARTEIPPNAQRSPDGVYWWDGKDWRRTGA